MENQSQARLLTCLGDKKNKGDVVSREEGLWMLLNTYLKELIINKMKLNEIIEFGQLFPESSSGSFDLQRPWCHFSTKLRVLVRHLALQGFCLLFPFGLKFLPFLYEMFIIASQKCLEYILL